MTIQRTRHARREVASPAVGSRSTRGRSHRGRRPSRQTLEPAIQHPGSDSASPLHGVWNRPGPRVG